jgi:micrococcal nuclease
METVMYEYKALLKRVVDGDTIDVYIDLGFSVTIERRLRLADVDTPELRAKDEAERERAQDAKKFVEEFIGNCPLLVVTQKTKAGKERTTFGRYVAEVYVAKLGAESATNLNHALVEAGHAKYI